MLRIGVLALRTAAEGRLSPPPFRGRECTEFAARADSISPDMLQNCRAAGEKPLMFVQQSWGDNGRPVVPYLARVAQMVRRMRDIANISGAVVLICALLGS